ncbi:adenosylcobalamin-dependent ribonucleoside-diphosphate reductase [Paraclostridium bifermentans]|uniref:adenosylcobalamin-dependent ribonucleoside-diphosphate reductase n=1 Tax=Paraclostridium bifermentans TaxID=1490 RepID=UPI0003FE0168|nr:adenosylcobalamin-dependent ribonucleoside-diphosphate reductase [Paraclostridium bifermentans]MCR1876194.1 adenosylcobalamin-dependent ribonucleoside-diphosphate reductase [Paraclostridium bifermentans]TQO58720.1 adenosylcobalamin-dependent ribonucleoside-diphosphate reductase [Paraclostridium bifermentans]GKZ02226.1 ribonucleoside-diphosphate reductase, adenosylcobalamin-dependent [Paraclostridium bifermentans]GKZ07970.1 ribonucleoside-diphosphate reductase, adenosylcobalamin-dependent [Pa
MKKIIKRDGSIEKFSKVKIADAVYKSTINSEKGIDKNLGNEIANKVEEIFENSDKSLNVEEIQDLVEVLLMESNRKDVAKHYILYREKRANIRKKPWDMDELQKSIWKNKYRYNKENFDEWINRISAKNTRIGKLIRQKKFLFAGRILANRGLYKDGLKVTYSNCYVLEPPKDNLEDIFDTAKKLARTFSYGGGVGIDISKLRPRGAKVNNSAKNTTGAVSFMELYSMTTGLIGQRGRRGALMISMEVSHPDIEDFIDIKTDLTKITKANISVRINDEFMKAVENNETYRCEFIVEGNNEHVIKEVDAKKLFMKLCKNNWDYAEPGILFWDNIKKHHLMSEDKEFAYSGVNPCAEEPLPSGGSCLLGSINLAEFVIQPFGTSATFDSNKFKACVRESVIALNQVLDEGLDLHPLQEQKISVDKYRQIGLGVMGIGDMLIKMNMRYGSDESIDLCKFIARTMLNEAVKQSSLLAKEYGPFKEYKKEAILKSKFFNDNIDDDIKELVKLYGLRNSQLLTIPPTGSISTMLGISGGIEPIFNISYIRKTESLHDEDVYYKVYTPIVKEYMDLKNITDEKDLPDIFVTAMNLDYEDRIKMQQAWQQYIDASISSTINLPYETTVEDVYEIYIKAWKHSLKGVTIFRDGCKRSGVLINEKPKDEKKENDLKEEICVTEDDKNEKFICPECGNEQMANTGGCSICLKCGYSGCN